MGSDNKIEVFLWGSWGQFVEHNYPAWPYGSNWFATMVNDCPNLNITCILNIGTLAYTASSINLDGLTYIINQMRSAGITAIPCGTCLASGYESLYPDMDGSDYFSWFRKSNWERFIPRLQQIAALRAPGDPRLCLNLEFEGEDYYLLPGHPYPDYPSAAHVDGPCGDPNNNISLREAMSPFVAALAELDPELILLPGCWDPRSYHVLYPQWGYGTAYTPCKVILEGVDNNRRHTGFIETYTTYADGIDTYNNQSIWNIDIERWEYLGRQQNCDIVPGLSGYSLQDMAQFLHATRTKGRRKVWFFINAHTPPSLWNRKDALNDDWTYATPLHRLYVQSESPTSSLTTYNNCVYDDSLERTLYISQYNSDDYGMTTWEFDGENWEEKNTGNVSKPPVRGGFGLCYDELNQRTFLFGGYSEATSGYLDDLWIRTGESWSQVPKTSPWPSARTNHILVYDVDHGILILWGGYNGTSFPSETWHWNGSAWTSWSVSSPSGRQFMQAVYHPSKHVTVAFGGSYGSFYYNETWEYDTATRIWSRVSIPNPPEARIWHSMAYNSTTDQIVLFGGMGVVGGIRQWYDSTWLYYGSDWHKMDESPYNPIPYHSSNIVHDKANQKIQFIGPSITHELLKPYYWERGGWGATGYQGPNTSLENKFCLSTLYFNDAGIIPHSSHSNMNFNSASDSFSIGFWFRERDYGGDNGAMIAKRYAGLSNECQFYLEKNGADLSIKFGNGSSYSLSGSPPALNDKTWHYVVITNSASSRYAYIDGVQYSLTGGSTTSFTNAADWVIGSSRNTANTDFSSWSCSGYYDEISFWNTQLSENAVYSLYNNGVPIDLKTDYLNYTSSDSLVAWFRMGDSEGEIANGQSTGILVDQSTYASNGSIEGNYSQYVPMSDRNFNWFTAKPAVSVNADNHFEVGGEEFLPISYMRWHTTPQVGISGLKGNMTMIADTALKSFDASITPTDQLWTQSAGTSYDVSSWFTPSNAKREGFIPSQFSYRLTDEPWDNLYRNKYFTYYAAVTGVSGSCCISGGSIYLSKVDYYSEEVDSWLNNFETYRVMQRQQNYTAQMKISKVGATGLYRLYDLSVDWSGHSATGASQPGGTGRHIFSASLAANTTSFNDRDTVFVTFPIKHQLDVEHYTRLQGNAFYRLASINPSWDAGTLDKSYYDPNAPEAYGDYFGNAEDYVDWTTAQVGYVGVYNARSTAISYIEDMRNGATGWQKPIVAELKLESYDSNRYRHRGTYQTIGQQRALAYAAMAVGCQGIEFYPCQTIYGTAQLFEPYPNGMDIDSNGLGTFRSDIFAMTKTLVDRSNIFLSPEHTGLTVSSNYDHVYCKAYNVDGVPTIVVSNLEEKENDYFVRRQNLYESKIQLVSSSPHVQAAPGDDMYRFTYEAGSGLPTSKCLRLSGGHLYVSTISTDPNTGTRSDPTTWSDKDITYWLALFTENAIIRLTSATDYTQFKYFYIRSLSAGFGYYDLTVLEMSSSGTLSIGNPVTVGFCVGTSAGSTIASMFAETAWHFHVINGSGEPTSSGQIKKNGDTFYVDLYDEEGNDRRSWWSGFTVDHYLHFYEYTAPYYDTFEFRTITRMEYYGGTSRSYYVITTELIASSGSPSDDIYVGNAGPASLSYTRRIDISSTAGIAPLIWNENYCLHDGVINYPPATNFGSVILHELYVANNNTTINVSVFADNDHDFLTETKVADGSATLAAGFWPTYTISLSSSFAMDHTKGYFVVVTANNTASVAGKSSTWNQTVALTAPALRAAGVHTAGFTNLDPCWKGLSVDVSIALAGDLDLTPFNSLLVYKNDSATPTVYEYSGSPSISGHYNPYDVTIYQLSREEPQWTFDQFVYYADYFALVAKSGVQGAQALYKAIAVVGAIDPLTFTRYETGVSSQGELKLSLRTSYERIFSNMVSTDPLQGPFTTLSEYIRVKSGVSVDEYLTEHDETVMPTYASISALFDEPISEQNVEERWL